MISEFAHQNLDKAFSCIRAGCERGFFGGGPFDLDGPNYNTYFIEFILVDSKKLTEISTFLERFRYPLLGNLFFRDYLFQRA